MTKRDKERSDARDTSWSQVEREFKETLGYLRDDIARLRRIQEGLGYTTALLICCACDSLAWHKDLKDYDVFTDLLPDETSYKTVGKSMFEALRHGLAHRFRPDTISIGASDELRFTLQWSGGKHLRTQRGNPNWLVLELEVLCDRALAAINNYEAELRRDEIARRNFERKHRENCLKPIPPDSPPGKAWQALGRRG